MHARTLTAVIPIRLILDSAELSRVGFGRSMSVWVGVSRIGARWEERFWDVCIFTGAPVFTSNICRSREVYCSQAPGRKCV